MKSFGYSKSVSFNQFVGGLKNYEQGIQELKDYLFAPLKRNVDSQMGIFELNDIHSENGTNRLSGSILNEYILPKSDDFSHFVFKVETMESSISKFLDEINNLNCLVIPKFEFKNYQLLKEINQTKTHFLFVAGKAINLLQFDTKDSVAVVGSRNVREEMIDWFDKNFPTNSKVVVSGLANGSDINGHRVAMKHNKPIIVFPGYPISQKPSSHKMDVWNYALDNGLIISSELPFSHDGFFSHTAALLLRNDQMAEVTSKSFVLDFKNDSGTHWHLVAASIRNKIVMPKIVYEENSSYLMLSDGFERYFKNNKKTSRFQLLEKIEVI